MFATLLTILLIALKLTHVNPVGEWSWFWVVCPMWISIFWKGGLLLLVLWAKYDE